MTIQMNPTFACDHSNVKDKKAELSCGGVCVWEAL